MTKDELEAHIEYHNQLKAEVEHLLAVNKEYKSQAIRWANELEKSK